MVFSWGFLCLFSSRVFFFYLLSSLFFASLRSVFIVLEFLRVLETKFQSNSFSFLKFEFD